MKKPVYIRILFLLALSVVILFPIFYTVSNSFMGEKEVLAVYGGVMEQNTNIGIRFFPHQFSLEAYETVLLDTPEYLLKFWRSILMCFVIVAGQVLIGGMCGFAFAKYYFRGWKLFFILFITFLLLPVQVTLVPNYIMLSALNLIGTWWALLLPGVFSPFAVFFMTVLFQNVPTELVEAGKIDGADAMQILFRIMMPIAKPEIASLIVLAFVDNWNMVEQPIAFLENVWQYPLSVFLASVNEENFSLQFVCEILSLIPVTLLFLFFNEELSEGISISVGK